MLNSSTFCLIRLLADCTNIPVLLTLSAVDPLTVPQFPNRRVSLSTSTPFITIGRTSKRNLSYEATENNAWIDSAVMSRDHAQVRLDTQTQVRLRFYIV